MPFDAATLSSVEDALSEGPKFHSQLNILLTRSGVEPGTLAQARARAEQRNSDSGYDKAPKRFVVQELLFLLGASGDGGNRVIAALITALINGRFPDASPIAQTAIADLKSRIKSDSETRKEQRAHEQAEEAKSARNLERKKEARRAAAQAARDALRDRFGALMSEGNAQQRGYLLESFLNDLFELEGLEPRGSFKVVGEQIDGSFAWRAKTCLVEAKWVKTPVAGADFAAFNYKIEGKTADTRGLFISVNGYSAEAIKGMNAKGALKFVCLDGAHIARALHSNEGLCPILERVWRHADETGNSYLPVSEL